MTQAPNGDEWLALLKDPIPTSEVASWVGRPDCGAEVLFTGTVRDHSDGRPGVSKLAYEAYEEQVVTAFRRIADDLRDRHPTLGRVAMVHRIGDLDVGDAAVVVAVSAPHRDEAFLAARRGIDTIKRTVPIWKEETWVDGTGWGQDQQPIEATPSEGTD